MYRQQNYLHGDYSSSKLPRKIGS